MPPPAVARKRSRAQLQEPDELAPKKDDAPLLSTKKRKLNTYRSSPARRGGPVGLGKNGQENLPEEDEKDELAGDSNNEIDTDDRNSKDIWEVEVSEPEEATSVRRRGPERPRPGATAKAIPKTTPSSAKPGRQSGGAISKLDMAISGNTEGIISPTRGIGRNATTTAEKAQALLVPAAKPSPQQRSSGRGRPRKSDILKQAKMLARQAVREKMMTAGDAGVSDEEEDAEIAVTPTRKRRSKIQSAEPAAEEPAPPAAKASAAKKLGRPMKTRLAEVGAVIQSPKGILSPANQRAASGRKSVAFNADNEMDLGFKDLPKSVALVPPKQSVRGTSKSLTPKSKKPFVAAESSVEEEVGHELGDAQAATEEVESDEEDGEMCSLCSGLRSTEENPIILCDGKDCDFAVHQECYKLAKVPDGDFFCRNCGPEVEKMSIPTRLSKESPKKVNPKTLQTDWLEKHLEKCQRILLDKLTGQKRIKLRGHDEEMQKVHQVVEQTVLAGEGNSMLVIGARGCGKTTLVESVISDLSQDHRDNFHVVRLNGFIHTDDKLALKETWRQLGREMELEDDIASKTSNYSDTLSSLLALLSHPSEISEAQPGQTAKSVIFILDEFDLFTTHPRQTLLYNLFDIAQARKAPIVVLGLTTKVDVVESLEKRVKSRFSHRYVYLSLPRSLPAFWEICKGGLCIETEELDDESSGFGKSGQGDFASFWRSMIEDLYQKDALFKFHVQSEFYRTKSAPAFFTSCIMPIAQLSAEDIPLTGSLFANTLSAPDSKLQILQGLSELELGILVAAARLDIILDTDTCNFAMAYDEYSSLTSRYKIQTSSTGVMALGASAKLWGREVALGAWERLAEYGLLVPAAIGGGGGRDLGAGGRMWKIDIGLEEITGSVAGLSGVMAKWCREI
ncbi:hypothetical protein LZ554_001949 [Drepanopeziza brunnea f. sp. 'monogermtubi']|nr:hypothetical protein LZ554_001949 [Drepanopeziza brunnea f. sp. 'monogermtubi']